MRTRAGFLVVSCAVLTHCSFLFDLSGLTQGADATDGAADVIDGGADAQAVDVDVESDAAAGGEAGEDATPGDASFEAREEREEGDGADGAAPQVDAGSGVRDAGSDGGGPAANPDAGANDAGGASIDGARDGSPDGPTCVTDLSSIGTSDFRIAFQVQTTTTAAALLNQRAVCNHGMLWDVRLNGSVPGALSVETDDGTNFTSLATSTVVSDGALHAVVVARTGGILSVRIDGSVVATVASATSFGSLPALEQGTDVCDGVDGTVPLVGQLTGVCLSYP